MPAAVSCIAGSVGTVVTPLPITDSETTDDAE